MMQGIAVNDNLKAVSSAWEARLTKSSLQDAILRLMSAGQPSFITLQMQHKTYAGVMLDPSIGSLNYLVILIVATPIMRNDELS